MTGDYFDTPETGIVEIMEKREARAIRRGEQSHFLGRSRQLSNDERMRLVELEAPPLLGTQAALDEIEQKKLYRNQYLDFKSYKRATKKARGV